MVLNYTSLCTLLVIEDMDANPAGTLHLLTAKKYHNTLKPQHVRETRGKNSRKVKSSSEIYSPVLEIDYSCNSPTLILWVASTSRCINNSTKIMGNSSKWKSSSKSFQKTSKWLCGGC